MTTTRMRNIRENNLFHHLRFCHLHSILILLNDEFEAPKSIGKGSKSSTDSRSLGITQEAKIDRKEEIVYLFRCVSKGP